MREDLLTIPIAIGVCNFFLQNCLSFMGREEWKQVILWRQVPHTLPQISWHCLQKIFKVSNNSNSSASPVSPWFIDSRECYTEVKLFYLLRRIMLKFTHLRSGNAILMKENTDTENLGPKWKCTTNISENTQTNIHTT